MPDAQPIDTAPNWYAVIGKLTELQRDALGNIAMGANTNLYHPRTIKALLGKGLISERQQTLPAGGGRFPVRVTMYDATGWDVHIAWCAWCAENVEEE